MDMKKENVLDFSELKEEVGKEDVFVDLEDKGKMCTIVETKRVTNKDGEVIYLALLQFSVNEIKKKWLNKTDRAVVSKAKQNKFMVSLEKNKGAIYICLKEAEASASFIDAVA